MGMIQIDMLMPKNCLDCPACNEYLMCAIPVNGRGLGENDVRDFSQSRPEWCPMKELIQCKDCKHHGEKYTHANGYEYFVCWRDGYGIHKLTNGFCDCGERKKDG